jgi:quercetin 2,3-dioxygenase
MIKVRHAADRGSVNLGWLDSKHSFSFGHFVDPEYMNFGPLRVINDDRIQPGEGFPTHGHENMEIISYILDGAHFLQIWIIPGEMDIDPGYEQKMFDPADRRGDLTLVGASDGRDGALKIHQDVDLYSAVLDEGNNVAVNLRDGRQAWVQVAKGNARLNGEQLSPGDGAAVSDETVFELTATSDAEVLIFDMA